MKIKITGIIFILTTLCLNTLAQYKEYVVKNNNDTVYGDVRFPFFNSGKTIKLITANTTYKFDDKSINAYYYDRKTYRLVAYNPEKHKLTWMQCIEDGKIKLYEWQISHSSATGGGYTSTSWYIQKDSFDVKELKTTNLTSNTSREDRQQTLEIYFADDKEISKEYSENDKFSFKNIIALIKRYNQHNSK